MQMVKSMRNKLQGVIIKEGVHVFNGETKEELEVKIVNYLKKERIAYQNKVNELEEFAVRIKENGLEKTSQHYQTLENKTREENK